MPLKLRSPVRIIPLAQPHLKQGIWNMWIRKVTTILLILNWIKFHFKTLQQYFHSCRQQHRNVISSLITRGSAWCCGKFNITKYCAMRSPSRPGPSPAPPGGRGRGRGDAGWRPTGSAPSTPWTPRRGRSSAARSCRHCFGVCVLHSLLLFKTYISFNNNNNITTIECTINLLHLLIELSEPTYHRLLSVFHRRKNLISLTFFCDVFL